MNAPISRKSAPGFDLQGCTAIITGASSGLGAEFARQLARTTSCLILAARSRGPMEELAARLQQEHPSLQILICPCDLATDQGREVLWQTISTAGVKPTLLVNNAGLGDYGAFVDANVSRIRQQIDVNITALTLLCREFLSSIRAERLQPAGILNVSSLASAMPIPDLSVYAATKAYVLSLSEALSLELRPQDIHVTAVCPGPTPTNFGKTAMRAPDKDIDRSGQELLVIPPERVVAAGLNALRNGKACVFPGKRVTLAATVFRIMPRPLLRSLLAFRRNRDSAQPQPD